MVPQAVLDKVNKVVLEVGVLEVEAEFLAAVEARNVAALVAAHRPNLLSKSDVLATVVQAEAGKVVALVEAQRPNFLSLSAVLAATMNREREFELRATLFLY